MSDVTKWTEDELAAVSSKARVSPPTHTIDQAQWMAWYARKELERRRAKRG